MKIINNVIVKGGSNFKYYDVTKLQPNIIKGLAIYSSLVKVIFAEQVLIGVSGLLITIGVETNIIGIGIDLDVKITNIDNPEELKTIVELFNDVGIDLSELPELTEEQFYDLTAPTE